MHFSFHFIAPSHSAVFGALSSWFCFAFHFSSRSHGRLVSPLLGVCVYAMSAAGILVGMNYEWHSLSREWTGFCTARILLTWLEMQWIFFSGTHKFFYSSLLFSTVITHTEQRFENENGYILFFLCCMS